MSTSAEHAKAADTRTELLRLKLGGVQQDVRAGSYIHALAEIEELRHVLDLVVDDIALAARLNGATWQDLGDGLNLTRQAAFARYNTRLK